MTDDEAQYLLADLPMTEAALTQRQAQVADGVFRGLTSEAIAGELNLSVRTVNFYIEEAMRVTHTETRARLVQWMQGQRVIAILAKDDEAEAA